MAALLGKDDPELSQLLRTDHASSDGKRQQQKAMVVVTRAQARRQLEEELLRRKKELLSGAQPNPVENKSCKPETKTNGQEQVEHITTLMKEQKRLRSRQCG